MAISFEEWKLWSQINVRLGEGWALPGYFCSRYTTGTRPPQPN